MQAQFAKNEDVIIVRLKGVPDLESIVSFTETCNHFLPEKKVIFNLENLTFVGSNGISDFMKIVKKIQTLSHLKICNAGVEFDTILSSDLFGNIEMYENEHLAKEAFIK